MCLDGLWVTVEDSVDSHSKNSAILWKPLNAFSIENDDGVNGVENRKHKRPISSHQRERKLQGFDMKFYIDILLDRKQSRHSGRRGMTEPYGVISG